MTKTITTGGIRYLSYLSSILYDIWCGMSILWGNSNEVFLFFVGGEAVERKGVG